MLISRSLFLRGALSVLLPSFMKQEVWWVRDRVHNRTFALENWTTYLDPSVSTYVFAMDALAFQTIRSDVDTGLRDTSWQKKKNRILLLPEVPQKLNESQIIITMYPHPGHWIILSTSHEVM